MKLPSSRLPRLLFYPIAWMIMPANLSFILVFDALIFTILILQEDKIHKNYKHLLKYLMICSQAILAPLIAYSMQKKYHPALVINSLVIGIVPSLTKKSIGIIMFVIINATAWGFCMSLKPWDGNLMSLDDPIAIFAILMISLSSLLFTAKDYSRMKKEIKSAKIQTKEWEEQGDFVMKFSHELRNPLNALSGSLELATELAHSEEMKEHLKNARLSSEFLLHIANNLLDSHKLKTERLVFNPQNHDIFNYIESFWGMISAVIQKSGIDGVLKVSRSVPRYLKFDKHRLTQILFNLSSNALKFTQTGSIKIILSFVKDLEFDESVFESIALDELNDDVGTEKIRANSPKKQQFKSSNRNLPLKNTDIFYTFNHDTLENHLADQEDYFLLNLKQKHFLDIPYQEREREIAGFLRIEIIDTGCGMTPEQAQKLFTKFGQVIEDPERRQKGTGLGLWITKELCKLMGGDIRVSSFKDIGTSFVVAIGISAAAPELPSFPSDIPLTRANKQKSFSENFGEERLQNCQKIPHRILIADDASYSQDVVKKLFEKGGVKEVISVTNGKEALKEYWAHSPDHFDFLVFDVNMPVISGITAAEEIRKHEKINRLENIPIIFVTGESSEKIKELCLDTKGTVKGFRYILKPLLFADIVDLINGITSKRHTVIGSRTFGLSSAYSDN